MLESNHYYQILINKAFFNDLTRVSGTKRYYVSKGLLCTNFGGVYEAHKVIRFIDITPGESVGQAVLTFHLSSGITDTRTLTFNENDFIEDTDCVMFSFIYGDSSSTPEIPEIDVIAQEIYVGGYENIVSNCLGTIVNYRGTDYQPGTRIIQLSKYSNLLTISPLSENFTLKHPLRFDFTVALNRIAGIDITQSGPNIKDLLTIEETDENITISWNDIVLPLQSGSIAQLGVPLVYFLFRAREIEDKEISATSLTTYSVNDISSGEIETIPFNTDSSVLTLKAQGNYLFSQDSVEVIRQMVSGFSESVEIELNENFEIEVQFKNIYDNVEFIDKTIDELKLIRKPVLSKTILHGTSSQETQFGYSLPYSIKLTPNDTHDMYDLTSVHVTMNNVDITSQVVGQQEDGSVVINITSVDGDVVITADVTDKYSLEVELSSTITDVIYSISSKFNVKLQVVKVSETQVSVTLNSLSPHTISIGQNNILKGIGLDGKVYIPSNVQIKNFNISRFTDTKTLTLQSIIEEYVEPTEFEMNLYQMTGEKTLVDKTDVLNEIGTETGTLRESCSLMSPIITMEFEEVPNFNYVYIPNFKRYYFVTDITNVRNNLWNISLKVDVLMSFKDQIRSQTCIVARNENDFNPLIMDDKRLTEKDDEIFIEDISSTENVFHSNIDDGLNQENPPVVVNIIKGVS